MVALAVVLLSFFCSFVVTFLSVPFLIKRLERRGIVGVDMNKFGKPKIPEMGGIGVIFGAAFGFIAAIGCFTYLHLVEINLTLLLASFSTIIFVGFLGMIDDLIGWKKGIKQWQHALIPVFAALPLMAVKVNNPPLNIPFLGAFPGQFLLPFFGTVSFGVVYSLIIVPAGVTGASNATNMLAGFNGLEAGLGVIMALTMLILALLAGKVEAAIILASILGALLAFLRYNWFPAKIFGGDSLTLVVGASIAAAAIVGDMEKAGVVLFALFFVELVFKASKKLQSECFGIPKKNGLLYPSPKGGSLTHWILRRKPMTETGLVKTILAVQAVVCIIVLVLFFSGFLR